MPTYNIPPRGYAFWELLAKALNEETVQAHDRAMMGMASIFGLEKGKPFKPDAKTRSILDTGRPKSAVNSEMDLPVNKDGTIDLYFGPTPPAQGGKAWIKTKPGEGFFMYFRFYGPLKPFYDKSWKVNEVRKVK